MLGLDDERPIPLDVLTVMGDPGVLHVQRMWLRHGQPFPISGDPHFRRTGSGASSGV